MKDWLKKIKLFILPCEENDYRPSVLDGKFLFYVTLVLVMLKFVSLFYFILIPKTPYFADVSRGVLVQMANTERSKAGLKPLSEDPYLIKAAELKAQDMLEKDYFSHWSPDGISPWHWFGMAGYDYRYAGENLAIGFLDAKDVHRAWIASPSHRDNIMGSDYNDIGIAVVEGDFYGQRTFLVVQVFGSKEVLPVALAPESVEPIITEEEPAIVEEESIIEEEIILTEEELIVREEIVSIEEPIIEEELPVEENNLIVEEERSSVLGAGFTISSGEMFEIGGIKYSIFNFLMVEYDDLIRQIIFFVMMFLGFVMVINIFVRFNVQHPDLIFKGLAFLALFLVFDYFDQMTLVRMVTETPWIG